MISKILILLGILMALSCSETANSSRNNSKDTLAILEPKEEMNVVPIIINIKEIANESLPVVEKVLGKVERKVKLKGYPCKMENCELGIFQNGKFEVIFKQSKADRITINDVPDLTTNDNAILALGLPISTPAFKNSGTVLRWTNIENIHEINIFQSYILIQISKPI